MIDVVPIKKEGNPYYPLPSDYPTLVEEGKRLSRVNACRQYLNPSLKKKDLGEAFVAALNFFDKYYLWPDRDADFNPLFYFSPLPTPYIHDLLSYQSITEWMCMAVMPRGSGKTTNIQKEILLQMVNDKIWTTVFATSSGDNMRNTGETVKNQLQFNRRLNDDFGPESPTGTLIGRRGEYSMSNSRIKLPNGSIFRGMSVKSATRSIRPRKFYLDDPEFDPKASTSMSEMRRMLEEYIFKIVLPACTTEGSSMTYRATFISKRHFAWLAMSGKDSGTGYIAEDPRFDLWDRLRVLACKEENGRIISAWPEMWPATKVERIEKAKTEPRYLRVRSLEEIEKAIGRANFNSEYLANPGDSGTAHFGSLSKEAHGYWYEDSDGLETTKPRRSQTKMCWYETREGKAEVRKMSLQDFCEYVQMFMTGDTSTTSGPTSDPKACALLGRTPNNDLFVLDCWAKRCKEGELVMECFKMADRWRCNSIHPEAIKEGISFYEALRNIVSTRANDVTGTQHLPSIMKLKRGQAAKTQLIAGSRFRFEHGKIKLPLAKRHDPYWGSLFDQIEDFNPDVENGGLPNDDLVDCVLGMSLVVLQGRLSESPKKEDDTRDNLQRMLDGETEDISGQPIHLGINWATVPTHVIDQIMYKHHEQLQSKPRTSRV